MFFAAMWMQLEVIILSELAQEQKTKLCMFFIYLQKLNIVYSQTYDGNNRHWGLQGGKGGRGRRVEKLAVGHYA